MSGLARGDVQHSRGRRSALVSLCLRRYVVAADNKWYSAAHDDLNAKEQAA